MNVNIVNKLMRLIEHIYYVLGELISYAHYFCTRDEKSCIRETKNLSTDVDSRTDTITFFHQEISGDGGSL